MNSKNRNSLLASSALFPRLALTHLCLGGTSRLTLCISYLFCRITRVLFLRIFHLHWTWFHLSTAINIRLPTTFGRFSLGDRSSVGCFLLWLSCLWGFLLRLSRGFCCANLFILWFALLCSISTLQFYRRLRCSINRFTTTTLGSLILRFLSNFLIWFANSLGSFGFAINFAAILRLDTRFCGCAFWFTGFGSTTKK